MKSCPCCWIREKLPNKKNASSEWEEYKKKSKLEINWDRKRTKNYNNNNPDINIYFFPNDDDDDEIVSKIVSVCFGHLWYLHMARKVFIIIRRSSCRSSRLSRSWVWVSECCLVLRILSTQTRWRKKNNWNIHIKIC